MQTNVEDAARQLRGAIVEFTEFNSYDTEGKARLKTVEQNLVSFSKTPYCLEVAMYLLERETNEKAMWVVSLMLKNKLKFDFDQIQGEKVQDLYHRVVGVISNQKSWKRIVLSNLSEMLVFIYIHLAEKLGSPLQFIQRALAGVQNKNFMLKVLELLPGQIDSSRLVIDDDLRRDVTKIFQAEQQKILVVLNNEEILNNPQIDKKLLLECFNNWINFSYDADIYGSLHQHLLFKYAVQCMDHSQLSEQSCEIITTVLDKVRPSQNHQLFAFLSSMIDKIFQSVQRELKSGDTNIAENFIKVLCDFGVKARHLFISNCNEVVMNFLKRMLKYTKDEELGVFDSICDFWVVFIEEMRQHKFLPLLMRNLLLQLHSSCCFMIAYPHKLFIELNSVSQKQLTSKHSSADEIRERREWAKQVFDSIGNLLGKDVMIAEICIKLQKLNFNDPVHFWPSLESIIVSAIPVAQFFQKVTPQLTTLVKTYQELKPTHIAVRKAYLRLFKALMNIEEKDNALIEQLFIYIGEQLGQPLLMEKAEKAFMRACECNPRIVNKNLRDFVALLAKFPGKPMILRGVLGILNDSQELMQKYLPGIFQIYIDKLLMATKAEDRHILIYSLIIIVSTISSSKTRAYEQAVKEMYIKVWPTVKMIFLSPPDRQNDQDQYVERSVKFLKTVMRSIKKTFPTFFSQLFETATSAFRKYPISSFLYLLQVSITVYSSCKEYNDYFRSLYETFCGITYTHLQGNLEQYHYLIDDYIGMNKRFLIYNADIPLKSSKVQDIFDLCQLCSKSQVHKISKAAYCLIEVLYIFYWDKTMLDQYNAQDGNETINIKKDDQALYVGLKETLWSRTEGIVQRMLDHMNKVPAESIRDCILDALLAQLKAFPDRNPAIWSKLLPSIPEDVLTRKEKEKIMKFIPIISVYSNEREVWRLLSTMDRRFENRKYREQIK